MEWTFEGDAPIYLQIMEQIKGQIASGMLSPGDKIPSVRELALEAGVNPNTMQKSLSELEREGILCSRRTAGRFVADSPDKIASLQQDMVQAQLDSFADNMERLGYNLEQAREIFEKYCKEHWQKP